MITQGPTPGMLAEWKKISEQYKGLLRPNRKSGADLLGYLQSSYPLTEITDKGALAVISENVSQNAFWAEKLPAGQLPLPKAFYLEDIGNGHKFYLPENKDRPDLWGGEITKIFVGVDLCSGFYMVEGSTMLWDELRKTMSSSQTISVPWNASGSSTARSRMRDSRGQIPLRRAVRIQGGAYLPGCGAPAGNSRPRFFIDCHG